CCSQPIAPGSAFDLTRRAGNRRARCGRRPWFRQDPATVLRRCLLIPNDWILASSVVGRIPSLAAAPRGPDTRPFVSARAASIWALSSACAANLLAACWLVCRLEPDSEASQLSSTEKLSALHTIPEPLIT